MSDPLTLTTGFTKRAALEHSRSLLLVTLTLRGRRPRGPHVTSVPGSRKPLGLLLRLGDNFSTDVGHSFDEFEQLCGSHGALRWKLQRQFLLLLAATLPFATALQS